MQQNAKKVLVTGDAGFIGSRLTQTLLRNGQAVIGVDQKHKAQPTHPDYLAVDLDLTVKSTSLTKFVSQVEAVFHTAALTRAKNTRRLTTVNTAMTQNLLEACCQKLTRPKFILVSSVSACGPQKEGRPLNEHSKLEPVSEYGYSKAACERVAMNFAERVPISIVRPPIVLGPGDKTGLAMFSAIQKWRRLFVAGQVREHAIAYVDDLVEALMMIACRGEQLVADHMGKGTYVMATQDSIRYDDLGRLIASLLGVQNLKIRYVPGAMLKAVGRLNDLAANFLRRPPFLSYDKVLDSLAGAWAIDSGKIRQLGFHPHVTLCERLDETIRWYQHHGWLQSTRSI